MNFSETLDFLDVPAGASFDLPPAEALAFFRAKGLKPSFGFADLAGEEHASAFAVAKMADLDLLKDVREAMDAAMAQGLPFREFADQLIPVLQAKGWWGRKAVLDPLTGQTIVAQLGSPSRLKTIFRTNMQSAYAVGRWEQIQRQAEEAPFLMYDAVDDHRTRPEHAAWDEKVLPADHPWWNTHYPPNGWNCRCSVIQLDESDLEALGVDVDQAPRDGTYNWTNPRTGKVEKIPMGLDPGFNHNPGKARLEQLAKLLAEKVEAMPADWRAAAKQGADATKKAADSARVAAALEEAQRLMAKANIAAAAQRTKIAQASKAAQAEIDAALAANTPYLAKAIKQLAGKDLTATELLAKAKVNAAKFEQSQHLTQYKQAKLAGKTPSAKAQAAFDALPDEAAAAFTTQLEQQLAVAAAEKAAQQAFEDLAGAGIGKQLAPKVLASLPAEASWAQKAQALKAAMDAQKAKQVAAQGLAGYKKAAVAGKIPTTKQLEAFNALDDQAKAALLEEIDAAKAAQKALAAPAPAAPTSPQAPSPTAPDTGGLDATGWAQVGPQRGSNPGGLYQDPETGQRWYVKLPSSLDLARNELLTARLYELAGVEVPELRLVTLNGRTGVASRWVEGLDRAKPGPLGKAPGAMDGFAADAWLANWDVVGQGYDNLLLLPNGKAFRVDTGGGLLYRAQGTAKGSAFGNQVVELETLRDPAKNAQAAQVFRSITPQQLEASVARVLAIQDDAIRKAVQDSGLDQAQAKALADKLIARKADLARLFPHLTEAADQAKRQAVEAAEFAARDGLKNLDSSIVTAIKGIATRAAKGSPLEAKDLERVREARQALNAWVREHGGNLRADVLRDVEAFYDGWIDDLEGIVAGGAGSAAKWTGGQFKGFAGTVRADPAKVKVVLPPAGVKFSQQTAKAAMQAALGHSAAELNVPKRDGSKAFKDVPLEHQRAIVAYTGHYYREINQELRAGAASPSQVRYADLLNEALDLSPKYQGDTSRGISLEGAKLEAFLEDHRQAWQSGGTVVHRGFISTSKGNSSAFDGNIILHIVSRTGVDVKPISLHPSEREVLLKHGTRFTVKDMRKDGRRWRIWLEEVP